MAKSEFHARVVVLAADEAEILLQADHAGTLALRRLFEHEGV